MLGTGVKSMAGSRKVVQMMNHFGHCVSYHIMEELETGLPAIVSNRENATPDGIFQNPGLATTVAWDNYDENFEMLSDSGTLHDTASAIQKKSQNSRSSIMKRKHET